MNYAENKRSQTTRQNYAAAWWRQAWWNSEGVSVLLAEPKELVRYLSHLAD